MIAHIINTDIGGRGVLSLYLDYRKRNFRFLENAAEILLDNSERVLVVTGFPIPPMNVPETDGPPGALALSKLITELGGSAEILAHEEVINAMAPLQKSFSVKFTRNPDLPNYDLVIFVETPGRARDGNHYSMSGLRIEGETFDWIAEEARDYGVPTIGIGDGGNEVGMGKIRDLIIKHIPLGERIASTVETDELVVSAVSNWGAYGLIARASLELGENFLADWDEAFVVRLLVENGIIDGVSKRQEVSVDGIPIDVHVALVELLKRVVDSRVG
ncbi:MAG: DUF4392 domain-containing protein [Thermococcus sp.]|nr:DUF4392 domain-containing protein [Thermococcus sp.]